MSVSNRVSIMQGRLSSPVGNRIQAFPASSWEREFPLAAQADLFSIEWVFEEGYETLDPLRHPEGITQIRTLTDRTGVRVYSICADYFMTRKLLNDAGKAVPSSLEVLLWLIARARELGVKYIVLPFVDASSLKTPLERNGLATALEGPLKAAAEAGVELHLETDLPPAGISGLLQTIHHPFLKANYDIGNSASLGYDPAEELAAIGPWLGSVHVKDRIRGGGTVPLGSGNADFDTCFRMIAKTAFRGPYILQVARESGLSELDLAIRNRRFVEALLQRHFGKTTSA